MNFLEHLERKKGGEGREPGEATPTVGPLAEKPIEEMSLEELDRAIFETKVEQLRDLTRRLEATNAARGIGSPASTTTAKPRRPSVFPAGPVRKPYR